ncbi:hypothetical protein CLIB1423_22S01750 [[Candida] railenensis]|uniref:Uncharacterized protein n=1 Tax=[Candida] railenensis TaxID=45579 RepID=A0A9P0QUS1_9ASCO|nr:hypothetical protein CLIB1423_22S01750 [[Candida] railenensis]
MASEAVTKYFLIFVLVAIQLWKFKRKQSQRSKAIASPGVPPVDSDFKWEETEPRPYRPFDGKRNHRVAMGTKDMTETPEDWLLLENTYLKNIEFRKEATTSYPKNTTYVHDNIETRGAVVEFYDKVVTFLCQRYPQYFTLDEEKGTVLNTITNEYLLSPTTSKEEDLILCLAANIEEDFILLMKDDPTDHEEEYKLRASITGFPAGFDPSEGHNQPISFIHKPVPKYESRLKFSMAKFFNKLEPTDLSVRFNWSVQMHKEKFALTNNHGYVGDKLVEMKYEDIDFENETFLRVERQIFTRLPKSRAVMMTVRTYLTPLPKVKKEGLAEELIQGIDGLPEDLAFYKKRPSWGEPVKRYLRE